MKEAIDSTLHLDFSLHNSFVASQTGSMFVIWWSKQMIARSPLGS